MFDKKLLKIDRKRRIRAGNRSPISIYQDKACIQKRKFASSLPFV
jgi:hypothetical protein